MQGSAFVISYDAIIKDIVLNVREYYTKGQIIILKNLSKYCDILGEKLYLHRRLVNGKTVNFKIFVMKKHSQWDN